MSLDAMLEKLERGERPTADELAGLRVAIQRFRDTEQRDPEAFDSARRVWDAWNAAEHQA